jgi:hypothetical protein
MKVAIDEPITVAGKANPNGATVLPLKDFLREKKRRNRPPKTREELEHALAVHERSLAAANEVRSRLGMDPLAENQSVKGWRAKLAALPEPKRKAKRAAPKAQAPLTPSQRVAALARRRRELEREREAVETEVRELVSLAQSEKGITVSAVASALGLSRQRLYQLAS